MVRLRGKNTWWSFYIKSTAETHCVQNQMYQIQSTWLCDVICAVSVTFPSFIATQLNHRTVSCLFPLCILQTGTGREVYSGLNGPQSVFIIFYRFSDFYCGWSQSSTEGPEDLLYVSCNNWLSIVYVFFFFPVSNWMCLFITLGSTVVSVTLLYTGCYWISLPLLRLYWSVKYICLSVY